MKATTFTGGARQVRSNPFDEPDGHLSLGEIDRRELMAKWRSKMVSCQVVMSEREFAAWRSVNRVPRRPPIYETKPKGAA